MANIMVTLQKLANQNTKKTFEFNAKEAAVSRDWQTEMSNTSHQREVKDLVAAGLNPVLSSGGSGAQSYTTSAASGVADSAVNAIGNVQSARTAAAATRYAAAQNAAAARYAAQMNYAAAAFAANKNYDLGKYGYDKNAENVKYQVDHAHVNSWAGLADKYLYNSGILGDIKGSKGFNTIRQGIKNMMNDDSFPLSKGLNTFLGRFNLPKTSYYRNLIVDAFVYGDRHSMNQLRTAYRYNHRRR